MCSGLLPPKSLDQAGQGGKIVKRAVEGQFVQRRGAVALGVKQQRQVRCTCCLYIDLAITNVNRCAATQNALGGQQWRRVWFAFSKAIAADNGLKKPGQAQRYQNIPRGGFGFVCAQANGVTRAVQGLKRRGVGKIWGSLICGMMVLLREDGHGCADLDGNNL